MFACICRWFYDAAGAVHYRLGGHERGPWSPIPVLGPTDAERKGVENEIQIVCRIRCCRSLYGRFHRLGSAERSSNDLAEGSEVGRCSLIAARSKDRGHRGSDERSRTLYGPVEVSCQL